MRRPSYFELTPEQQEVHGALTARLCAGEIDSYEYQRQHEAALGAWGSPETFHSMYAAGDLG